METQLQRSQTPADLWANKVGKKTSEARWRTASKSELPLTDSNIQSRPQSVWI